MSVDTQRTYLKTHFLFYIGCTGPNLECSASEEWLYPQRLTGWVAVLRSPTMVLCTPREDPGSLSRSTPCPDALRILANAQSEHRSPTS